MLVVGTTSCFLCLNPPAVGGLGEVHPRLLAGQYSQILLEDLPRNGWQGDFLGTKCLNRNLKEDWVLEKEGELSDIDKLEFRRGRRDLQWLARVEVEARAGIESVSVAISVKISRKVGNLVALIDIKMRSNLKKVKKTTRIL